MDRRRFGRWCLLAAGEAWSGAGLRADDVAQSENSTGRFNAITPTLGGRQFWADEYFRHEWHIQRNVLTGHCRLLDGANLRHAWGSFDECRSKLDQVTQARRLPPMQGPGVVVLHGLFRSAASMSGMSRYLREQGGYTVFNVNYPTTRGGVADHARSLDKVIASLEGIDEIHFVAHSLGNLVVRCYLGAPERGAEGSPADPRVKRIVMLGPPNQGAELAQALGEYRLFHAVAGRSATELGRDWKQLEARLATPDCPFGILAGGRAGERGYNPWLGQDNDLIVSVESTRLAGAADFAVLPVIHTLMMDDPRVQQYTLRFLQRGYFVSEAERHAIERPAAGS